MTMIRKVVPLALAALALLGCSGPRSAAPDAPGVLQPMRPATVTMDDGPVKLTGCKAEDGHVVFRGTLTGTRRVPRDYVVGVEVLSGGALIEEAYAFLTNVPAGSKPVPVVGSGTTYVTSGGTYACHVLTVDVLSRNRTTPSR
jgi:hypothetical protein